jgi:hypothetical protein
MNLAAESTMIVARVYAVAFLSVNTSPINWLTTKIATSGLLRSLNKQLSIQIPKSAHQTVSGVCRILRIVHLGPNLATLSGELRGMISSV